MCGRYYVEIDDKELQDICDSVMNRSEEGNLEEQLEIKLCGEIFPTDIVPVQIGINRFQAMKWGFTGSGKRPLINARSETALTKPTFRDSMLLRRCLIPASGYYEWQKDGRQKIKHRIYLPGEPLYFAGCYRIEAGSLPVFVILTKDAVNGLEVIHERMPVIIPKHRINAWFLDGTIEGATAELLCRKVPTHTEQLVIDVGT